MELSEGQERYSPAPQTVFEDVFCGVCGELMLVKRNELGPTSFAEAMDGSRHHHDHFYCQNIEEKWHRQAKGIINFKKTIPSAYLTNILDDEIQTIISTKTTTKNVWGNKNVF